MGILQKNVIVFVASGDFGGHLIANSKVPVFPRVTDIPTPILQGTDSRCNLYSVTTGWMLFQCLFSFGEGL